MKKVAFFLDNKSICDIDAYDLDKGNPGIGGTEYLFLLISSKLSERSNGLEVILYLTHNQVLPRSIKVSVVSSLEESIRHCENEGVDYLVVKHLIENVTSPVLSSAKGLKFIVWCHVFACYWELDAYEKNKDVAKIVFVGKEMMQLYWDHPIMRKSTYIYNAVSLIGCRYAVSRHPFDKRANIVTYVGSLVPFKGFHLLAKVWKEVLTAIPDAELYVIGSGQVYDSSTPMGKYGIAEDKYERLLFEYLSVDGDLLPGVHFMGKMGNEKNQILLRTKVGVPNPSGVTETFCLSAVEMQSYGAKIATIQSPGYLDTVKNGILYRKQSQLALTIIRLLQSDESHYDEAMDYFENKFSVAGIVTKWECLLLDKLGEQHELVNYGYRLKWLKGLVKSISRYVPINKLLPPIERFLIFYERKIKHQITFMDSNVSI